MTNEEPVTEKEVTIIQIKKNEIISTLTTLLVCFAKQQQTSADTRDTLSKFCEELQEHISEFQWIESRRPFEGKNTACDSSTDGDDISDDGGQENCWPATVGNSDALASAETAAVIRESSGRAEVTVVR